MHRYRVTALYRNEEYILHDPLSSEQIYDDELIEEAGKTASFNFLIPQDHVNLDAIVPLATRVFVYDNGQEIYDGRVIGDKRDIINNGTVQTAGALSYLADTQQEPTSYTGGINAFIDMALGKHNAQSDIKITRGTVTVVDSNDYINRSWSDYMDTLSLLNDKLVKTHGGYLRIRHQTGNNYLLDYLSEYGENEQVVRLGENLTDLESQIDASEAFTRLIPLGAEIEQTSETDKKEYTTIASVNGGKTYIERADLKERYGCIITKVLQWEDVTVPANLLKKAQEYLNAATLPRRFTVGILDLSLVENVAEFELGAVTRVISKPHGIDLKYMLSKRTRHLTAPQNDSLTLGSVQQTITQAQNSDKKEVQQQITDTQIDASNQTINTGKSITGAKGGYVVLDAYNDSGELVEPWRILIMDTPDKKTAKNVIQLNVNGIGFSTNGVNGDYRNAWTIDGKLSADFIQSGSLTIGGKTFNANGAIVVLDANDKQIGRWDKNGFTMSQGTITGGSIKIGPFAVDDDGVQLGDFDVSTDGSNQIRSSNGTLVIEGYAGDPNDDATITLGSDAERGTFLSSGYISAQAYWSTWLADKYNAPPSTPGSRSYGYVEYNIIRLWEEMEDAQERIKYLEDNMPSG